MNMMNRSFGGRPMATPRTAAPAPRSGPQPTLGVRPPSGPVPPGGRPGLQPARASSAKADDMFLVMRQLCDLLTKETAALKRYRTDEVKALSDRKEQLARLYQSHMNGIHTDPSILQGLDIAEQFVEVFGQSQHGNLLSTTKTVSWWFVPMCYRRYTVRGMIHRLRRFVQYMRRHITCETLPKGEQICPAKSI